MRRIFNRKQRSYANGDFSISDDEDDSLRSLIERRCLSPLTLNDDDDNVVVYGIDRLFVRTRSYHKLPQHLLQLTVLKLDGSSFDVHVGRNATVGELKQAVEEVFTSSPKEDEGKISWSHVWGHFCLSYEGQRLVNDKACIQKIGIKDGDQLQFVRHVSVNYSHSKRRSRSQHVACKPYSAPLSRDVREEEEKDSTVDHSDNNNENQDYNSNYLCEDEGKTSEFKLAHFLKGWLSYTRLRGAPRKGTQGQSRPSRFAFQCLGGGHRMIELQG